jgi:hypothetical protein
MNHGEGLAFNQNSRHQFRRVTLGIIIYNLIAWSEIISGQAVDYNKIWVLFPQSSFLIIIEMSHFGHHPPFSAPTTLILARLIIIHSASSVDLQRVIVIKTKRRLTVGKALRAGTVPILDPASQPA